MTEEIKQKIKAINNGHVPCGYKRTSIGVVPTEWEEKTLRQVGKFSKGKGLPGTEMKSEGIPCVGYGDIYTKYNYKFEKTINYVDKEIADESVPIENGTLLFTCSGETAEEIGKCVCYNGEDTIYAGGDIALLNIKNDILPLFVGYQQNIPSSIKQKARYGQGHSVVHIYGESLGKLGVVYPKNKSEQVRVVDILIKWDEMVQLQDKLIESLILQKKALIQKLLTPSKEWKRVRVGELTKEISIRNKDNVCKNIKSVSNKLGFINQDEQFSKQVASQDTSNYKKVNYGNIVYNPSRINVGSIAIYKENEVGIVSPMYVVFKCKEINPDLLVLLLSTDRGQYDIKTYLTGSVRDSLSYSDLAKIEIFLPNAITQKIIVDLFATVDNMIELQKKKMEKLKLQQMSMQQLLLAGIVRV